MRKSIMLLSLSAGLLLVAGTVAAQEEGAKPEDTAADAPAAEAKEEPKAEAKPASGGAKYGPAGCGLGSLIFDADSGFTQIFAATTNGTSGNQTWHQLGDQQLRR